MTQKNSKKDHKQSVAGKSGKPESGTLKWWIVAPVAVVLIVVIFIIAGGIFRNTTPETFNCFKLCSNQDSFAGGSGVSFEDVLGWQKHGGTISVGLSFPPAEKIGFKVNMPTTGRFEYSIGLSKMAFRDTDSTDVVITFVTSDGRPVEIERRTFDPKKAEVAGRWHKRSVELPQHLGSGKLEIEVRGLKPGAPEGTVFIGNPRIIKSDERKRTRIIVIGVDTLRADHLGCYGYNRETSQTIDELASEGVVFENAIATSPWTFTSFGSVFSGKYPSSSGATMVSKLLPAEEETFAEILSRKGLLTAAISNNVWFSPSFNLLQGFDTHIDFDNVAKISLESAQKWIFENRDVDFLLFIHLIDPHLPYSPPPELAKKFDRGYAGPWKQSFNGVNEYRAGNLEITPGLNKHLIDLYDAEISYLDTELGKFFDALRTTYLLEDTTIILVSDHGEEFLDHGSFEHGHTMYNELLRVPLIIKGSGFSGGKRVSDVVSPMDIFSTLLGICDVDYPTGIQSLDLSEIAKGRAGKGRTIYSEQIYYGEEMSALTDEEYKYVYHVIDDSEELYELKTDPGEQNDLAADRRSTSRDRRRFVQNFIAEHQNGFHVRFNRKFEDGGTHFVGRITTEATISEVINDRIGTADSVDFVKDTYTDSMASIIFDIYLPEDTEKGFTFQLDDPSVEVIFEVTVDENPENWQLIHIGSAKEVPESVPFRLTMDDPRFSLGQPVMLRAKDPGMYIWAIDPGLVESPWETLSSEEEERLRSLGYIGG